MKKLKLTLLVALLGMVSIVGAQDFTFNVKGGLNLSDASGDVENNKMKVGFHLGVGIDYSFAPNMAIQSGLFFTSKGAKMEYKEEFEGSKYKVEATVNANFIQLPVHFAYKIDVAPETKVVLHAGPYIAYGVGGKFRLKEDGDEFVKLDTFDKDYGFKRFDAGLGVGVGAEFGRFLLDLGWDMGFVNLGFNEVDINSRNAYLSVGYRF